MQRLSDLLKNHRVPGVRLSEIRSTCAKVAQDFTSYTVMPKQVKYKDGTLYFSVPSVIKSELLIRERDLKTALKALGIEIAHVK